MRKIAFWDWQYLALLQFLQESQQVTTELYQLFCEFRPVDYNTQHSFCIYSPDNDIETEAREFEDLELDKKQDVLKKLKLQCNPELFERPEHQPLQDLIHRFLFEEEFVKLILFFFLFDRYASFRMYFLSLEESQQLYIMEGYTGLERNRLVEELKPTGKLASCGILDEDCHPELEINRYNISIAIAQFISYYLDDTHSRSLASYVFRIEEKCSLPLSAFNLASETVLAAMATLKKKGAGIILLYGQPGTGKTEFSKRLVLDAGMRPCFVVGQENHLRPFSSLYIAKKLIDPDHDVLIIDEAEALLTTSLLSEKDDRARNKSVINQYLDDYQKKLILIVNHTFCISSSTLRRMHVTIGFKTANCSQRKKVWNELNKETPIFSEDEQREFSVDFISNPARIKQVQAICDELMRSGENRDTVLSVARDMLGRSAEVLHNIPYRKKNEGNKIDIGLLNTSVSAKDLLEQIGRWNDSHVDSIDGCNILFYGAPGTGKTAFARYIVNMHGIPLIVKRASDLLDRYVGGTEKKIRDAFDEAQDCALLIDEADSFLTSRSSAVRSWERSQVNEFLTCMESFSGLLIATTNFTSFLDPACLRRFQFKVEFYVPDSVQRIRLAEHFFKGIEWDLCSRERISAMDTLTPGDFSAVSRRMRFADKVTAMVVCDELATEKGLRTVKAIGFGE